MLHILWEFFGFFFLHLHRNAFWFGYGLVWLSIFAIKSYLPLVNFHQSGRESPFVHSNST